MKYITIFFAFLWRGLDALRKVLHLIVLLVIFGLIVAALSPHIPVIPQQAALVIAPQGPLVEQLTGDPVERAVAEMYGEDRSETLLRDVVEAIHEAKKDRRIKVLVLDLSGLSGGGLVKLEELTRAIDDFRSSGKRVIAFGESYDQTQYYVAAHADDIYMDPQGFVFIQGYGYFRTFLKGAIDKLDVDVHIFKAGKFKSYTDQFSRSQMSDQEREETSAWLNAVWSQYQAAVTKARGMDADAIAQYVNDMGAIVKAQNGDTAAAALERGLVTQLKSRRDFEEYLQRLVGFDYDNHTYQHISYHDYLSAARPARAIKPHGDHIGVVVASGEIVDGDQPPGIIGSESAVRLLRQALYDDSIKAVVLRIDSPGGSMFASEVIRREIDALKKAHKPVIASMSSLAASGGYYIAMDADEIWSSPSTLTGSIGVFGVFPTFQRTLEKIGVTSDGIGTTPLADALRPDRTLGEEPREILQSTVDHAYSVFIGHVADARNKSVEDIDAIAQGRVWAGSDAAQHGLVDKLGSFNDAIQAAAERAHLGKNPELEYIEPPLGWREALVLRSQAMVARFTRALLPQQTLFAHARRMLAPIETEVERAARFNDPQQLYMYCSCSIN
ncbi:MAG TPA: signal peptide peptidase SppA [Steroidobacteraceae bacterium]|nr:signal peptide peptidase SppA [Steroidobacteraceae bacterium]